MLQSLLVLSFTCAAAAFSALHGTRTVSTDLAFDEYVRRHRRTYRQGTAEFSNRRALFVEASRAVARQNARPNRLWTASLNGLADRTPQELAALRGYDRSARPQASGAAPAAPAAPVALLSRGAEARRLADLPPDFSWQPLLKATGEVLDQSTCGSCWAFASAVVLRAHAELYQRDRDFAVEEIVSCTPNPHQCGGDGGCSGATAELAMDYVVRSGCGSSTDWAYESTERPERCPGAVNATANLTANTLVEVQGSSSPDAAPLRGLAGSGTGEVLLSGAGASFGMLGYRKLPENRLMPVMLALYENGPMVVSIAAGQRWNLYYSGIMDFCDADAVIDHAVVLVGFGVGTEGTEQGWKYWQLQNSWGPYWGEKGFIRLARHDDAAEDQYCGTDNKPEIGSGCKGGPPEVTICGTCGILYDAVIPVFRLGPTGLWATGRLPEGRRKAVVAQDA